MTSLNLGGGGGSAKVTESDGRGGGSAKVTESDVFFVDQNFQNITVWCWL